MRIVACIKQVPSTNEVRLDPEKHTILRDGRQSVVNPFDAHAVEEAVRLKETCGGTVLAISMGIPAVEELLRDALARGADEAVLLSDRAFAGADTLATSYTLAAGIRKAGPFVLILCGKMAVDGDTAQIGPELAEQLGIPHLTEVDAILSVGEGRVTVSRQGQQGPETVEAALPALLTLTREVNTPRMPTLTGVRRSLTAPFVCWGADDLKADRGRCGLEGSPTQVVRTFVPQRERETVFLSGSPERQAEQMVKIAGEVLA